MSSSSNPNPLTHTPRRTHRRRISTLKLMSDRTAVLPQYIPAARYHQTTTQPIVSAEHDPFDEPPEYPDSAEEADEDTDTDTNNVFYVPHLPPPASPIARAQTASPRRAKRFVPTHKRRQSQHQITLQSQGGEPNDVYLDSLLARSVHALEMSNTLLQSSISTQTSLSTILASDSPADYSLEARAVGLSTRIRDRGDARSTWADDLEEITRDVEGLFNDDPDSGMRFRSPNVHQRRQHLIEGSGNSGVSASLPNSSSIHSLRGYGRRPSLLDLRESSTPELPRLQYSQQKRANLISPPPRAITQYVASTHEADSIILPSTIGLRSLPSLHPTPEFRPVSDAASSSTTSLLLPTSLATQSLPPKLTDKPLEPSTPAYNMLASFVYRAPSSGSATPSSSFTHSFMPRRRDSSVGSNRTERGNNITRRTSPSPSSHKSPDRTPRQDRYSAFKNAASRGISPLDLRPMTPPVEESSSSSDGYVAKRTVQSLRKILDDQPAPPPKQNPALRAPAFMPRTPAPVPQASTSTAIASISRLFTKGKHSSSTHAPSPPLQSAMKRPPSNPTSTPSTPLSPSSNVSQAHTPTPSLSIPEYVGRVLSGGVTPSTSSGQSTPSKRISFAELPESYASTRPPSTKFKDKAARKKRRAGNKGKNREEAGGSNSSVEPELGGWWSGWLGGVGASAGGGFGAGMARHEEKMEDRMTRNWGGRMSSNFGGGLDEWAM